MQPHSYQASKTGFHKEIHQPEVITVGKLDGKVALITGAGSGIGKGMARAFAREGADLVVAARRREKLEGTAEELRLGGTTVLVVPTDVRVESQIVALFEQTVQKFGRLDILVNNSGAWDSAPLEELTLEAWQNVMDVNLTGPFLCTREAFKIMKSQGGGRIINIGSISAQMPRPNAAPYATTKRGLIGLTHVAMLEGRQYGISASCLHPGNTRTETNEEETRKLGEPDMTVDAMAEAALTMATMPPHAVMYEAIVLPFEQPYFGRG